MMKNENLNGPFIPILVHDEEGMTVAGYIEHGIEEEGIPFQTILDKGQEVDGHTLAHQSTLGVALSVDSDEIALFSRLRKDEEPLLVFPIPKGSSARLPAKTAGKNAARIVKGKPLVEE